MYGMSEYPYTGKMKQKTSTPHFWYVRAQTDYSYGRGEPASSEYQNSTDKDQSIYR